MATIIITQITCKNCPQGLSIDLQLCVELAPPLAPALTCPIIPVRCGEESSELNISVRFGAGGNIYLYEQTGDALNLPKYMSVTTLSAFPLDFLPQEIELAPFVPLPGEEDCRLVLTYRFVPDAVARVLDYVNFAVTTVGNFILTSARFIFSLALTVIALIRRPSLQDQARPPIRGQDSQDDNDFPS